MKNNTTKNAQGIGSPIFGRRSLWGEILPAFVLNLVTSTTKSFEILWSIVAHITIPMVYNEIQGSIAMLTRTFPEPFVYTEVISS